MTAKSDFTEQEWKTVREGPPSAGLIVTMVDSGGTFRETFAIGKAYTEARKEHGESQLLDELLAAKPEVDRTHYHSLDELKEHNLQHLRDAMAVLEGKATQQEIEEYRRFVIRVAEKVAHAHREHGVEVSPAEQAAIDEISATVGAQPAGADGPGGG
jgi:hypothetical protein